MHICTCCYTVVCLHGNSWGCKGSYCTVYVHTVCICSLRVYTVCMDAFCELFDLSKHISRSSETSILYPCLLEINFILICFANYILRGNIIAAWILFPGNKVTSVKVRERSASHLNFNTVNTLGFISSKPSAASTTIHNYECKTINA